jgi:UDP-glucose 4-epimerase
MKILITGVAGFIGSNLASRLLQTNNRVIGIDNMSYGEIRNINSLFTNPQFEFIQADLCNHLILKDIDCDVIVHLASQKIPRYSNALRTLEENNIMLKSIVNKAVLDKCKIVYASTSDVYGKNPILPFSENSDLVLGPTTVKRWAYALSKIYGEQYILANSDQYNIEYTIVRFFGSYGPNQNLTWWGGPQSVFITKAFNKEPIEIHGNGNQTRTFTYIDDTIDALIPCILDKKSTNEIFNISSDPSEEITINALAKLIWQLINGEDSEVKLHYIPYSNFGKYEDVERRVADIAKIKSYFNYKPVFTLKKGLISTIDWQRKILNL